MSRINKTITAAFAALALTTASVAGPSKALAGGHGHGGHGHHGGHHGHGHHGHHHGHGHYFHGHHFHAQSCWKWTPRGMINVCYRRYY